MLKIFHNLIHKPFQAVRLFINARIEPAMCPLRNVAKPKSATAKLLNKKKSMKMNSYGLFPLKLVLTI